MELLPCPFCGSHAEIIVEEDQFQIVGCANRVNPFSSLLCPNPSIVVYKDDVGNWDYKWWNRRTISPELLEVLEDARQALAHAIHILPSDSLLYSSSIALKGAEDKVRDTIAKLKEN